MFAREYLFYVSVNLFFGEYFRAPLGDQVCCLVMEVSMVLFFYYVVCCFMVSLGVMYACSWCVALCRFEMLLPTLV